MNKLSKLLLFLCGIPTFCLAQKTEVAVQLNSGLYSFRGDGAESVSRINNVSYTNNPYGSRGALSYGLSLDVKRVSKSNFIFGADLGYEMLRSKIKLRYSDVIGDIASDFAGRTYLNTSFINLFPYFGARIKIIRQVFDLTAGADIGYILNAKEKGKAESVDNAQFEVETSVDRKTIDTDIRPRIQLSTAFGKAGLYVGYSYGLRNYRAMMIGSTADAYSRMWRLGLSYRIQ
jgi:hypothetical protein